MARSIVRTTRGPISSSATWRLHRSCPLARAPPAPPLRSGGSTPMDAPPPAPRPASAAAVELALVRRALAGDGAAKAEVERVLATIPRIVTSLLRSAGSWVAAQDQDDVVQDC